MTARVGKGFECCETCANQEIDYECAGCKEGSRWEGQDTTQHITVHELKFMINKKAAE